MDRKVRWAAVVALGSAIIGVLTAFGVPITEAQEMAILRLLSMLGPFAVAFTAYFVHSSEDDPSRATALPGRHRKD